MPRTFCPNAPRCTAPTFDELLQPIENALATAPPLAARGNRPLQMNFEQQLRALIYFHLEEHTSGRHLIQALEEDDFARNHIAPPDGIQKSSFFEAINNRGLEQLGHVYEQLQNQASHLLPAQNTELGELVGIDGSFIQAVLSMYWADYRDSTVGWGEAFANPNKALTMHGKCWGSLIRSPQPTALDYLKAVGRGLAQPPVRVLAPMIMFEWQIQWLQNGGIDPSRMAN